MRVTGLDGGPHSADVWVRLVSAIGGVLDRYDADEVSPQQTRALRALSRLFTTHGVTVHVERHGRRVATLGEGGPGALSGPLPGRLTSGLGLAGSRSVRSRRRDPVGCDQTRVPDRTPVVIGSHPTCDLVLTGLKPRHAVLGRDVQGRTVLKALAGRCYVDGSPVVSQVVDEDSDIRLGEHRLSLGQVAAVTPV